MDDALDRMVAARKRYDEAAGRHTDALLRESWYEMAIASQDCLEAFAEHTAAYEDHLRLFIGAVAPAR